MTTMQQIDALIGAAEAINDLCRKPGGQSMVAAAIVDRLNRPDARQIPTAVANGLLSGEVPTGTVPTGFFLGDFHEIESWREEAAGRNQPTDRAAQEAARKAAAEWFERMAGILGDLIEVEDDDTDDAPALAALTLAAHELADDEPAHVDTLAELAGFARVQFPDIATETAEAEASARDAREAATAAAVERIEARALGDWLNSAQARRERREVVEEIRQVRAAALDHAAGEHHARIDAEQYDANRDAWRSLRLAALLVQVVEHDRAQARKQVAG